MYVDEVTTKLSSLEKLRINTNIPVYGIEKIVVMPEGRQRKVKGTKWNVPVECDQTCNQLVRPSDRSGIIMLELRRKLQFRGHVLFQAVRR